VSWEKIGVTVVGKPAAHSSGLYLRIPKKVCEAYDLFRAQMVVFTIERVLGPAPGEANLSEKGRVPKKEAEKGEAEE